MQLGHNMATSLYLTLLSAVTVRIIMEFSLRFLSYPGDYVVEADSLNAFKNRLDKYWTNQDVVYDYKSDLTGTGGLPVCA